MEVGFGQSREKFPTPNELTLCHLFLQHKATFMRCRRYSEALRKYRHALSLTSAQWPLCVTSLWWGETGQIWAGLASTHIHNNRLTPSLNPDWSH